MKTNTISGSNPISLPLGRWLGPARLALPITLVLAFTGLARAENAPIPLSEIGAKATADYQGEALGITATPDGARLRCGFQKLEGQATSEGLWLESTVPGGGQLRLVAVAVGRGGSRAPQCPVTEAASSVRSGMSIVTVPQGDQAPLGAPCTHGAASFLDMPLLTELETAFSDVPFYRHAAPNGATSCLRQGAQTLARTGSVSAEEKVVRFTRLGVTEEYSVSVDGVRQDFVIGERPAGTGHLRVELALSGARAEGAAYGAKVIMEGSGRALAYSRLRATDASGQELRARLEVDQPNSESRKQKAEMSRSPGRCKAESRKQKVEINQSLLTSAATRTEVPGSGLVVVVEDAEAVYPVRIDPTFSDANWVSLNPGMAGPDSPVSAIAVDGSGNVYAGGAFSFVGTVTANYIAKWNGGAWSALGSGMDDEVNALAVSGTTLYAGGRFTTAGDVTANYVAAWDGSAWSALGSGVLGGRIPPCVSALAVSGTNLYAGGTFNRAGGVPAYCIAKWNGSAWSALGEGMSAYPDAYAPQVFALAVSGTNLYAGGWFFTAGGVWANYIAAWNGIAWSALGLGMNNYVYALAVSGTDLYAGGAFSAAGGVSANCIAKWNGTAWSALGDGMNNSGLALWVDALAVSGTTLYAGGQFTTAGGVTANYIAAWNGSAWSALGAGMDWKVRELAADGSGHLFVGGDFSLAGTNVSPYIAQANIGAGLSAGRLGSPVYSPVTGLGYTFSDATIGQPYHIQSSPSLDAGSWTNVTNFTYTGPRVISDRSAAAGAKKFYRAVSP